MRIYFRDGRAHLVGEPEEWRQVVAEPPCREDCYLCAPNERYWEVEQRCWAHNLKEYGVEWDPTIRF
jgi:hypothetical protein